MSGTKAKTATSTPRLSEFARHFSYPSGIVKTVWPRLEAKGREVGLRFDWWQSQLNSVTLGYRADGIYAASVGGIGESIPRQVGKTYNKLAMFVLLCIIFPRYQVIWTAHHLRTSTRTFRALQGILKLPGVAPYVQDVRLANGEQQVVFTNGSMIMFGARQFGFGRGFEEIDAEAFDEAQILDTKSLEDMVAATNQSRHEHGALLVFMGTPPRPLDPSEAFRERRREAWAGEAEDAIWLEFGADPKSDPDDRSQWPRMNPSFPKRTPLVSMLRLKRNLKDEDSWNREGRGIWDEDSARSGFNPSDWVGCQGAWAVGDMKVSGLALAVSFDMAFAALVVAAVDADAESVTHVRLVKHGPGAAWVSEAAKAAQARVDLPVLVDPMSPANALVEVLERDGVKVQTITTQDVFTACGGIDLMVRERRLRHSSQAELDRAVERAKRKTMRNGRWVWDRQPDVDSSPLEAATLAAWMTRNSQPKRSAYEDHGVMTI